MCGICGQFNFGTQEPAGFDTVRRMTASILHRGPDDEGYHFDGPLGLGFRRLSIIDLRGGHQPMTNQQQSVWVVFNGEIYNFPELKVELEGYGYVFRTHSDTEVVVHGYSRWGLDVFDHLNGMFGLAIWDAHRKRLVVARDAFGIKLVYYRLKEGSLSFGSEIRAVRAADSEPAEVDPEALSLFLRYRFTPSPRTIYRGIQKLAPGTMLVVESGVARIQRWYGFKPEPFSPMPSDGDAAEELSAIYRRAIKRQLLSDVPVGLLLSGGLDSGLLLGLMSETGRAWPTFTIGYGADFKDDELVDAAETAAFFGAKHTSIRIDRKMFEGSLSRIVTCLEEPVAASSIVPMYFVSQRACQDVKVAFNGQGPDELFGGYTRHLGVRYRWAWASLPSWVRKSLAFGLEKVPRGETLRRGINSLGIQDRLQRYQNILSIAPGPFVEDLFQPGLLRAGTSDGVLECWSDLIPLMEQTDDLGGLQLLEVRSTLPDELLMYADKLSMAHSLEVRVPYLDREVVEYVERLNASFKVRNGVRKWLHRNVCRDFLPARFLHRKKRGFAVNVVDDWLRDTVKGELGDVFMNASSEMYKLLRPGAIEKLLAAHRSGERDHHKVLFSLIVCESLLRSVRSETLPEAALPVDNRPGRPPLSQGPRPGSETVSARGTS